MSTTGRRIVCEVCGLGYPANEWWENLGYCPNCDQPYGPNARKILDLPRTDLDSASESPKEDHDLPEGTS